MNANHGISTNEIAEALGMQRTNVSTALGELLREGRVKKKREQQSAGLIFADGSVCG